MKPPKLPKRVKRQLSVDESMARYLWRERRYLDEWVGDQLKVLQVYQGDKVLCIQAIHRSPNGVVVEVV